MTDRIKKFIDSMDSTDQDYLLVESSGANTILTNEVVLAKVFIDEKSVTAVYYLKITSRSISRSSMHVTLRISPNR